jgi:hypothetical protein
MGKRNKPRPITHARVLEVFTYDLDEGILKWRVDKSHWARAGQPAGCICTQTHYGYLRTCVDGKNYLNHRLIWFYVHGEWPPDVIDHVNGNGGDNRLCNLRLANKSQNGVNRKGCKGTLLKSGSWYAQFGDNYKKFHLGPFATEVEARTARKKAMREHFGEFANEMMPIEREPEDFLGA